MPNGHAAFKLVFKLVLFSKTLEGCYSMPNGHAVFKIGIWSVWKYTDLIHVSWVLVPHHEWVVVENKRDPGLQIHVKPRLWGEIKTADTCSNLQGCKYSQSSDNV